jgi:SRSO17 transposase
MGRKTRRCWAPLYLLGLLGPGDRKSLQPMAERPGLSGHDQLQHFIASPAWDDAPLWAELAHQADALLGGSDALLVIDDTALPKQGTHSVGVARQYCGALGKKANCQSLVSLTLARHEVLLPLGLRLFLPEEWSADATRCARAGVPEVERTPRSKGEIALGELNRLREAGVQFGTVLADAGYGSSAAFHARDERGLRWAVGILRIQKVYATNVTLVPPPGRARKLVPNQDRAGPGLRATRAGRPRAALRRLSGSARPAPRSGARRDRHLTAWARAAHPGGTVPTSGWHWTR